MENAHLPVGRAAAQVQIFRLQTSGFSQDGLDLEVDLVGDLCSQQSCQKVFAYEEVREGGLTNLALGRRDGHQLEQPLALGVGVERLHGVLGRRLNLS